jgi:hypothetical protein
VGSDGIVPQRWEVYTKPVQLEKGQKIMAVAQRIGYLPSKVME